MKCLSLLSILHIALERLSNRSLSLESVLNFCKGSEDSLSAQNSVE